MLVGVVSAPHVCGPQAVRYRKEPESGRMRSALIYTGLGSETIRVETENSRGKLIVHSVRGSRSFEVPAVRGNPEGLCFGLDCRFASKFPPVPFATSLVYHLEVLSQTARHELSAQEERLILIRG